MQPGGKSTKKYSKDWVLIAIAATAIAASSSYANVFCQTPVWHDEFENTSLNNSKWTFAQGDGCDQALCGWGNNELQWYSSENVRLADGLLIINAKKEPGAHRSFTSAKITTRGKFSHQYGRIEARMKLPMKQGTWPAFWMLPDKKSKPWPVEGEIDILEQAGQSTKDFKKILGAIHFGPPWPDNTHYSESLLVPHQWGNEFHTYRVDWTPNRIRWSVDSKVYGEVTPGDIHPYAWPFNDKPFYLILNLAVGGTLGGAVPNDFDEAELQVDFVRVYEMCELGR